MKKETCSRCGRLVRSEDQRYCNPCHAEYARLHRPKYSELSDSAKRKSIARSYTKVYVKKGAIKKEPCAVCHTDMKIEAHHKNYNDPLNVMWLCRKCHLGLHQKINNAVIGVKEGQS